MTFSENLRLALDRVRATGARLDLRPFTVELVEESWSGERPGIGTRTLTSSSLTVSGSNRPRVRRMTSKEVWSSGGKYVDSDLRVGPFTPTHVSGGLSVSQLRPTQSQNRTVYYRVSGSDEVPTAGGRYELVDLQAKSNLSYYLVLRRTSQ